MNEEIGVNQVRDRVRVAAGQFRGVVSSDMQFAKQLGLSGVSFNVLDFDDVAVRRTLGLPQRPQGLQREYWSYDDLARLHEWVGSFGLSIESLENVPTRMMAHIKAADSERNRYLDGYCQTIENMGRAGIPVLGYNFMILTVVRSNFFGPTRGGALTGTFNKAEFDADNTFDVAPVGADEVWERYSHFIKQVVPVAEAAGVNLALHPDDPPLSEIGGVARILGTQAGFEKALSIVESPSHGINFCVGSFAQADVSGMYDTLTRFTKTGKVFAVHLRNIRGSVDDFVEEFVDDGDVDVERVLNILIEEGFDGFILDDHVPQMVGDQGWRHRGRAFCTGYIRGMLEVLARRAEV